MRRDGDHHVDSVGTPREAGTARSSARGSPGRIPRGPARTQAPDAGRLPAGETAALAADIASRMLLPALFPGVKNWELVNKTGRGARPASRSLANSGGRKIAAMAGLRGSLSPPRQDRCLVPRS